MKRPTQSTRWYAKYGNCALAAAGLLIVIATSQAAKIHCPPRQGEGAKKVRDIDGDNVKDHRYQGSGGFKRTKTDEHGSRIEEWCLNKGTASSFVWMYVPGKGKTHHGKNVFIGYCGYDGGGNSDSVKKKKIDGKMKFKTLTWFNIDQANTNPTEAVRFYTYDAENGTISQTMIRDDAQVVPEAVNTVPPFENGNGIGLPIRDEDDDADSTEKPSQGPPVAGGQDEQDEDSTCTTGEVTEAHESLDTPSLIPDMGLVESIISVPESSHVDIVREVIVVLMINHERIGDLIVTLSHQGQTATLINRIGQQGGGGFGCEGTGIDASIDDCADDNMHVACDLSFPVVIGSFQPDDYPFPPGPSPMSVFDGTSPGGDWVLTVTDNEPGGMGTLNSWELHLAGDGDVGPGTIQPEEARTTQEIRFPQLINLVESLGLFGTTDSDMFWWDVGDQVGPLEAESIELGSLAEEAGLLAGDVVIEMLNIPHHMLIPEAVQDLIVEGGTVQLGFHIERNRDFGRCTIDLRVQRGQDLVDLTLNICPPPPPVPIASPWGLTITTLAILVAGAWMIRRGQRIDAPA